MKNNNVISVNEYCLVVIFFLVLPSLAAAVDFNTMLGALKNNIPAVIRLTTAAAYIIGFWLVVSAIIDLKKIGQSQSSMSATEGGLGGPLMRIALGIALIYFPSTVHIAAASLWGDPSIINYTAAASDPFKPAKEGALLLVQAVGYVSFVRGFVILSHSTQPGAQQGTVGKGILHIVGGILAINIWPTIQVVGNSLGVTLIS